MNKYYIVNDIDRPDMDHVTIETNEGLKYLCDRLKDWPAMGKGPDATPLEDFGFNIAEDENIVTFVKISSSNAKYSDGRERPWQGRNKFSFLITDSYL